MLKLLSGILLLAALLAAGAAYAEEVKISRDNFGVPHIFAKTDEGAFFGQGYAEACDRLFQLEMIRLSSSGRMAEALGEDYVEFDKMYLRYFPAGDDLKSLVSGLDESQLSLFGAFAAGINKRIDEVAGNLPKEFAKYGIEPEKWTTADVVRVWLSRHRYLYDGDEELRNLEFLTKLVGNYGKIDGKLIFDSIVMLNDTHTSPVIDGLPSTKSIKDAKRTSAADIESARMLAAKFGVPYGTGSYAVAIAASKSESGNSMLLAGPKFGFGNPPMFYECSLQSKTLHAAGIQSVGVPGLSIAQNESGAWTVTGGNDNQLDYFVEMLNSANNAQYRSGDEWKDISKTTHKIEIKGGKTVDFDVLSTENGIIVSSDLSDPKNPAAFSKRTAVSPKEIADSWMNTYELMKSSSSEGVVKAFKKYPIASNLFYINRKNQPLFMHTGKFPIRSAESDPRLPMNGPIKEKWTGFLPYDKIPISRIPSRGFYADWNSKPCSEWDNGEKCYLWGSHNRVDDIREFINSTPKFSFKALDSIDHRIAYTDIYSHGIKSLLIEKLEGSGDPEIKDAVGYLKSWDGIRRVSEDGSYQEPGPVILHAWITEFARELCPELTGEYSTYAANAFGAPFVYNVMMERELPYDFLKGRTSASVCESAMKKTIADLTRSKGDRMGSWTEKTSLSSYSSPAAAISGKSDGSPKFYAGNRASSVLMWEVNRFWVKGAGVLPPGQGFYGDHASDQIELYNTRHYKTTLFYEEDVRHNEESSVTIEMN